MHASPQAVMPDVECADFTLSSLADRGLLTTRQLADFQNDTRLADLGWRVSWNRSALADADGDFRTLLRRTQGFVVFMHGWNSSGSVWEHLPALTCAANPRLVALTPDLNGFGRSPFMTDMPALEHCDPSAMISVVAYWVELLGLRSSARARRRRNVITFVGHSMGGAALFYLNEQGWHENEYARCAIAPTLLIEDDLREEFYHSLGVDSSMGRPVEDLKARLTPRVVEALLGGADEATCTGHLRIFEATPRGTLAQTFSAMTVSLAEPQVTNWCNFRVILAHDDRMLNVSRMLRLLDDLGLAPNQIQVVSGDHYLFSVNEHNRRVHIRNREIVLGEVLYLHEVCRERQGF